MSNTQERLRRGLAALAVVLLASALCAAQDDEAFKKLFATDFSKQTLAREQLKDLDLSDLKLLRGVVFGRHGRVFRDRDIQGYLKDQEWYKPDPNFTNVLLNERERASNATRPSRPGTWNCSRTGPSRRTRSRDSASTSFVCSETKSTRGAVVSSEPSGSRSISTASLGTTRATTTRSRSFQTPRRRTLTPSSTSSTSSKSL